MINHAKRLRSSIQLRRLVMRWEDVLRGLGTHVTAAAWCTRYEQNVRGWNRQVKLARDRLGLTLKFEVDGDGNRGPHVLVFSREDQEKLRAWVDALEEVLGG